MELADALSVIEELGYWDSAVGWCAMIGATTGLLSAFLPSEHARAIYADEQRAITGGVVEPRGSASRTAEGLVASGRWSWGSGCHHSDWMCGGCRLAEHEDGRPRVLTVFFERGQIVLHDTWHAGGLKGTGSGDFEVEDALVPDGRWVELGVDRPGVDDPLYRFPFFGLLALGVTAVGLGLARRAIDALLELAPAKRYVGSRRSLAERPAVQVAVAEAQARLLSARSFLDQTVGDAWLRAEEDALEIEHRRRLRLAATHGMRAALEVVDAMHELAGGSAVFESSPLERLLRDVHVAASHGIVARRTHELTGRLALGLETDVSQL